MSIVAAPPEVLITVLRFLDSCSIYQCSLVNKYISATATPLLWHSPLLHHEDQFVEFLASLAMTDKRLGHYVRHIDLKSPHRPTDEQVLFMVQRMPFLESFTYRAMHHLGKCKKIKALTLRTCQELSPLALLPLAHCPLEFLDLSGCKWLTASDTAFDLRAFDRLQLLCLICCEGITTEFIHSITRQHLAILPHLSAFSITSCEVKDEAIVAFVQCHPHLEHLTLMDCTITDVSLLAFQEHLSSLHYLEISYCSQVTKEGVRRMIKNMPCLDMIGLKNCNIRLEDFPEVESSPNIYCANGRDIDRFSMYELELVRHAADRPFVSDTSHLPMNTLLDLSSSFVAAAAVDIATAVVDIASATAETAETAETTETTTTTTTIATTIPGTTRYDSTEDSMDESYGYIQEYLNTTA
ncbi:hypothetical protein BDF14DRAFT_1778260 [Spinellus fusiger]|nr:hypothetical protein BDF14DRAFT_1778260 [Spinellus fusiger]